jgi:hypothetical protein
MAYTEANVPVLVYAQQYGQLDRTYNVFEALRRASAASPGIGLKSTFFDGTPYAPGKKRTVKLVYNPINCDDGGSCDDNVCTPGTPQQPKIEDFDITECTSSVKFTLEADDLRFVDANNWTFGNQGMALMMEQLPTYRRKLALALLTKTYALAGVHADGNPTHQVVNLATAYGRPAENGVLNMQKEYTDLGYGDPYILGGGDFYTVQRLRQIGGLNDDGIYVDRLPFNNVYYDDALAGQLFNQLTLGNWAISIAPGTLKLITFNANAGMFRTDMGSPEDMAQQYYNGSPNFIRGTFFDPGTGFTYDFDAKFEDCTHTWTFQYRLEWDIWAMPPIVCNDTIGIVNGIMKWRTCPQVAAACPTGTSVSIPLTEDTYSWTPTLEDLETIYQSSISGYNFSGSGEAIADIGDLVAYMNAHSNTTFTANGADVEYTGISAISATFNNGAVTATFTS